MCGKDTCVVYGDIPAHNAPVAVVVSGDGVAVMRVVFHIIRRVCDIFNAPFGDVLDMLNGYNHVYEKNGKLKGYTLEEAKFHPYKPENVEDLKKELEESKATIKELRQKVSSLEYQVRDGKKDMLKRSDVYHAKEKELKDKIKSLDEQLVATKLTLAALREFIGDANEGTV